MPNIYVDNVLPAHDWLEFGGVLFWYFTCFGFWRVRVMANVDNVIVVDNIVSFWFF